VIARTARKHTPTSAAIAKKPRILACSRGIVRRHRRCDVLTRNGADDEEVRVSTKLLAPGGWMLPLHLGRGVLLMAVVFFGGLCVAQECVAQEGDPHGASIGAGSVVAPSPWLGVIVPQIHQRIDLKLYGFYIGDLDAPSAQVDLPVRTTKFLTITPSYLYYSVPAKGLDDLANLPGAFADSYDEHQFRIDGTVTFSVHEFEIQARNMYVRRLRPAPADDSHRYRGRVGIVRPLAIKGRTWRPYVSYESYFDHHNGGWNKDRIWTGVTVPVVKHVSFQPSYLWERSDGLKTINYVLFGLIVNTK
jgi:hypothetical protein